MAETNAKKLEKAKAATAQRQRKRRRKMKEDGVPDTSVCDRVIVEALSFALASTRSAVLTAAINVRTLLDTATSILVEREGYSKIGAHKALKLRLARRQAHLDSSYVPSLVLDPELQAARIAQARETRDEA